MAKRLIPIKELMKPCPRVTRLYRNDREVGIIDEYGRDYYRISLDRCKIAADLFGMLIHLAEKDWITTQHLQEIIEIARWENNIEVNLGF